MSLFRVIQIICGTRVKATRSITTAGTDDLQQGKVRFQVQGDCMKQAFLEDLQVLEIWTLHDYSCMGVEQGGFTFLLFTTGSRYLARFKAGQHCLSLFQQSAVRQRPTVSSSHPNAIGTWMYRKALLRTLRFEVFLSSTLGMLRFNVSKHSFKCARLKKTQVVCQLVSTHQKSISQRAKA